MTAAAERRAAQAELGIGSIVADWTATTPVDLERVAVGSG
jgi:hypothetical protein